MEVYFESFVEVREVVIGISQVVHCNEFTLLFLTIYLVMSSRSLFVRVTAWICTEM
jgi:hypothetical protein